MVIGGRRWVFKAQMGFIRRRGVGMVIEGRRCDIDHLIYSCRLLRSILGLRCLLPGPSCASPSSEADQAHPHPPLR